MTDQTVRAGTLSAIHESHSLAREDWHGFCFGFSTGHMGWAMVLRKVDTEELDQSPIPTRQASAPAMDCAFFRQASYDSGADRLQISYYHKGAEKEWALERPKLLHYERIRGDEKELRIDLGNGTTALLQLHLEDTPERIGDDNRP